MNPMILFFPQYQAGYVPSHIPVGTIDVRRMWQNHDGFVEVPLQQTDINDVGIIRGVRFRKILCQQLKDAASIIQSKNPDFIMTTGGDCGASFSSIAYLNEKYDGKIGVIWVDAHADIHAPSTSPSGNYHGMVLRHLMGELEFDTQPSLPLKPHQIAYLGLRDTESAEDEFIADNNIIRFNADKIMNDDAPMYNVIDHFKKHGITHLHLHVDCDVMDEKIFPHVHVPEPRGLGLERLLKILKILRHDIPMAGCCLTEYAPQNAGDGLDILKRIYFEGLGLKEF